MNARQSNLSWTLAISGVLAVFVGLIVLLSPGSKTAQSHHPVSAAMQPLTDEDLAAMDKRNAEVRIAQLSLRCVERYVCHVDPAGHALPIFIDGMDQSLHDYLEERGFRDAWTDSGGGIDGQTIGPYTRQGADQFIATSGDIGSGMYFREEGAHEAQADGAISPWDIEGSGDWTVTWTLYSPSGQIVRKLQYTVPVTECTTENVTSYCSRVKDHELREEISNMESYSPPAPFEAKASDGAPPGGPRSEANLGPLVGVSAAQLDETRFRVTWHHPHDPAVGGYVISENDGGSGEVQSSGFNTGFAPDATSAEADVTKWEPQFRPHSGEYWQFCVTPFGRKLLNHEYMLFQDREACSPSIEWR